MALLLGCAAASGPLSPSSSPSSSREPAAGGAPTVVERQPPPPRRPATIFTPSGKGRPSYLSPPLRADPRLMRKLDPYTRAVVDLAADVARELKLFPPVPDERLNGLALDIARLSRGRQSLPSEVMRFLSAHHGVVEADPHMYILRGPDHEESALAHFRKALPRAFQQAPFDRIGVGAHRGERQLTTVVLLWEQHLELSPIPRQLPSEGRAWLRGRFLRKSSDPQLVITMPGGFVRRLPLNLRGDAFEGEIRCAYGDGRYQVEMVASDASGPMVLANFPIFCGVPPPTDIAAHDDDDPAEIDPAVAEQEIFALINNERRTAGLAPLIWDNRLGAIARAHSRDMASNRFIAHVSPTTGGTEDRARRAGLRFRLILENVGQEGGVRQAHQGFMHSPGHRANVLNAKATHVGVGVVVTRVGGGGPIVVTEMFAGD